MLTNTSGQLETLARIGKWLGDNPEYSDLVNKAVFSTSNKMGIHPNDLAIYILIRTASI